MGITIFWVLFLRIRWNSSWNSVSYRKNWLSYNLWFLSVFNFYRNKKSSANECNFDSCKWANPIITPISIKVIWYHWYHIIQCEIQGGDKWLIEAKARAPFWKSLDSNLAIVSETFFKVWAPNFGGFSKDTWTSEEFRPLFLSW